MKIADLEWMQVGRWHYLLVHTEEGITGLGEGGVHGYPEAIGGVLQAWKPYLLGQDPLRIEHHWQFLYRNSHFRGAVIGSAHAALLAEMLARVAAVRETVGNGVDLCVEIHRRMDPHHAFGLARELAKFRPYFLEDPLLPDSVQNMGALQREIEVPIATGERLHTLWEFNELLAARGCRFIRPDVCLCGGLTHSKKIAAIAEAYHVGVIPHNPLSPVSTAACVQLDACIPNFALQEYTGEDRPPYSAILEQPLEREGGYLIVPDRPGIGVDLDLD